LNIRIISIGKSKKLMLWFLKKQLKECEKKPSLRFRDLPADKRSRDNHPIPRDFFSIPVK